MVSISLFLRGGSQLVEQKTLNLGAVVTSPKVGRPHNSWIVAQVVKGGNRGKGVNSVKERGK